jgi:glycosyltransferase involved in cell wall biosynthesis
MPPYSGAAALRGASIMAAVARLLSDRPRNVLVFTTVPSPEALPGLTVETLGVPEVENALSLPARILGELRLGWAAGRRMFLVGPRCDLAVVSTPGYLAALLVCSLARWRRVGYVLELRDVYPQVYAEAGLLSRKSRLYRFFARRSKVMYEGAQFVIAATRGLAREVSDKAPAARVRHVYNGFPSNLLARQPVKYERFTVCFHGTLGFFQDVETLLEVARRLGEHQVDCVVVGYGRKEAEIVEAALPNLKFYGRQPFEKTIDIVERCHVGLCLRKDEAISKDAFPVKVWEYLGLGLPSIVTPVCEAGEFVKAHDCGFQLPSGSVSAIVECILWLKNRPNNLRELSARCRETAAQFTREETGLEAAQVILSCVRSNSATSTLPV